jgi:predicted RNA-binding Zn ribbon-like protein
VAAAKLAPFRGNFVWSWRPADGLVEAILGPITLSALTLLVQSDVSRIKQCAGDHCGWLFFDTTKNKQRRWCEMEVCGNRAKQKAHRARLNATRTQLGG